MSTHALFYNSVSGDRVYDADSFTEWLRPFFMTGVFNGDLFVSADSGMTVKVGTGYVNINGKVMNFEEETSLTLDAASATLKRIDAIVARRNDTDREITIEVIKGTQSASPVAPEPVRSGSIYDLVLAHVFIDKASVAIVQGDITDTRPDSEICGWVASTVTEITFDQIVAQLEDQFITWFNEMKGQLSEDAAGHLQEQIDTINLTLATKADKSELGDQVHFTLTGNNLDIEPIE